jgi:hypothetical protein
MHAMGKLVPNDWMHLLLLSHQLSTHLLARTLTINATEGAYGSLPSSWNALRVLTDINVSRNLAVGSMPPQWMGMTSLVNMDLSFNQLGGEGGRRGRG